MTGRAAHESENKINERNNYSNKSWPVFHYYPEPLISSSNDSGLGTDHWQTAVAMLRHQVTALV